MATSLEIDEGLKGCVEQLASQRSCSVQGIMLEAIQEYAERAEAREAFEQEARNAWEEYRNNGLHLTGQEVRDWLATWGAEDERPIPKCHK